MFKKGEPRHPAAGRKKGTPNKISTDIVETLIKLGHDPAAWHVKLFNEAMSEYLKKKEKRIKRAKEAAEKGDQNYDEPGAGWGTGQLLEMAIRANSDLMRYCYPQRKALEVGGPDGNLLEFKTYNDLVRAIGGVIDVTPESRSNEGAGNNQAPSTIDSQEED